jgi:hypothetical protein
MALIAGNNTASKIPMIEIVKTISTNVKARLSLFSFDCLIV